MHAYRLNMSIDWLNNWKFQFFAMNPKSFRGFLVFSIRIYLLVLNVYEKFHISIDIAVSRLAAMNNCQDASFFEKENTNVQEQLRSQWRDVADLWFDWVTNVWFGAQSSQQILHPQMKIGIWLFMTVRVRISFGSIALRNLQRKTR